MNSKLEIRINAAKLAVMIEGITPDNVIAVAKDLENYILGESELPEVYDSNAAFKQVMNSLNKNFDKNEKAEEK